MSYFISAVIETVAGKIIKVRLVDKLNCSEISESSLKVMADNAVGETVYASNGSWEGVVMSTSVGEEPDEPKPVTKSTLKHLLWKISDLQWRHFKAIALDQRFQKNKSRTAMIRRQLTASENAIYEMIDRLPIEVD